MSSLQAFGDLDEERDRFVDRNWTLRNPLRQGLAFHQFHDDELLPIVLFETIERGDVRVIDLGKKPGLTLEPIQAFFVSGELLGKNFDGDVASEFVSRAR